MSKSIGLREAISIGIGGMVGGGIFAVLGLAVSLAKGGTPLAFLFAGIIALLTSYSYVKLSLAYPDRGGTVKFINQGFGQSIFSGGINNLLHGTVVHQQLMPVVLVDPLQGSHQRTG